MRGSRLDRRDSLPRGVSQLACVLAISTRPTSSGVTQCTRSLSTGGGWKGDVTQLISDSRIERSRRARLVNPDMMRPQ